MSLMAVMGAATHSALVLLGRSVCIASTQPCAGTGDRARTPACGQLPAVSLTHFPNRPRYASATPFWAPAEPALEGASTVQTRMCACHHSSAGHPRCNVGERCRHDLAAPEASKSSTLLPCKLLGRSRVPCTFPSSCYPLPLEFSYQELRFRSQNQENFERAFSPAEVQT